MRAGRLRKRVQLQTPSEAADSYGQLKKSWATVGTYSAEVRFLTGREAVNAQQVKAGITHLVKLRYVGPISPTQQLLLGGRVFRILAINNVDERNREYQIYAQEIAVPTPSQ